MLQLVYVSFLHSVSCVTEWMSHVVRLVCTLHSLWWCDGCCHRLCGAPGRWHAGPGPAFSLLSRVVGYKGSLLNQSFTVLYLPVLPVPALPPTHAFMQHVTHTLVVLTGFRASHGVYVRPLVGLLAVLHNGPTSFFNYTRAIMVSNTHTNTNWGNRGTIVLFSL